MGQAIENVEILILAVDNQWRRFREQQKHGMPERVSRQMYREQLSGCSLFFLYFFVWYVLHQVAGLAFQRGTHFIKHINRDMPCRTSTHSRYGRGANARQLCQLFLVHIIQSKQHLRAEFYHNSTSY